MRLAEALPIARRASAAEAQPFRVGLCTGFTPLHLETFLTAHLSTSLPARRVEIQTGLYGDLLGTLDQCGRSDVDAAVAIVEWPDIDPRLGVRSSGGWFAANHDDIIQRAHQFLSQLEATVRTVAALKPVVICFPTLPFPPFSCVGIWKQERFELELLRAIATTAANVEVSPMVTIISSGTLAEVSVSANRFDVQSELATGYPYQNLHSDALASLLAAALAPPQPKKGLITDLDNTLWAGIVGEVGAAGVSWDLDGRAQHHALYQQALASLAESGVLIAVATKNEDAVVEFALKRDDLLIDRSALFPVLAGWGPKSEAVTRILSVWNITADAVVFIDDSPLELAEVNALHPGIECKQFYPEDPAAVWRLIQDLRRLFGKKRVSAEDSIRHASIRANARFSCAEAPGGSSEVLLATIDPEILLEPRKGVADERALELINKTNQFNLNGERLTAGDWVAFLQSPDVFLITVSYRDRFGPLGNIAAIAGRRTEYNLEVCYWVLSCRAFSRRIEHASLSFLYEKFGIEQIRFKFRPTAKNGPWQQFYRQISGVDPSPACMIDQSTFISRCPQLYHRRVLE